MTKLLEAAERQLQATVYTLNKQLNLIQDEILLEVEYNGELNGARLDFLKKMRREINADINALGSLNLYKYIEE